ncbi:MAG TPA: hypothetical protein VFE51_09305 [Verrucomicrobiae bacterium]|nr:hypothetical protein [Verrucomicrobiae bacterium]
MSHAGACPVKPRAHNQTGTGLKEFTAREKLEAMKDMKMLFSARDRAQVEMARDQLTAAGVSCEVREYPTQTQEPGTPSYRELWVQANTDYHTASILYASPVRVLRQRSQTCQVG